jgi:hypothetical protein
MSHLPVDPQGVIDGIETCGRFFGRAPTIEKK